ncbi:hypothetical protein M433DRAFT_115095 [Acidomyces richmondensis BFW]|nr:MAG: hypothetical protein FE78DRAFT_160591 [Acidomyces sp. 'richmondensis']KYG41788.1 hypothetical protein M433DRAFT_115095 [Acidomyces richmondensis BFW]
MFRIFISAVGPSPRSFDALTFGARSQSRILQRSYTPFRSSSLDHIRASRQWQWPCTFRNVRNSAQRQHYYRQPFNYQRFQATQNVFKRWAARPTFYYEIAGVTGIFALFYVSNLEKVPVSNRYRFNIITPGIEASIGSTMYNETMQEFGRKIMSSNTKEHRLVKKVLERLIPKSGLDGEQWEVHVIDDPMANAFVIPGGKVFVFRGILDVAGSEDGLAAVLGHEIAHNVAHHAAERMSQNIIFLVPVMIGFMLAGLDPGFGRLAINLAFTLPGSRAQESEADYIGLLMMAKSCYNPRAALGLWERMEKEEKGRAPPQFLSTHPSSHNRLDKIREWLPKAEQAQRDSECQAISPYMNRFRREIELPRW